MQTEIANKNWNRVLLSLIDNFEGPKRDHWITLTCGTEEFEAMREFLAGQVAQGLLKRIIGDRTSGDGYRLTEKGYLKYLPTAKALRVLGNPQSNQN